MHDLTAKRTLVKSPPELWNELSEVERLARHLDAFGEIKITRLEPEHTVAWEGEKASGTVSIEPSGWGTKVTLRAQVEAEQEAAPAERSGEGPETAATKEEPEAEQPAVQPPEASKPEAAEALEPEAAAEPEPAASAPRTEPAAAPESASRPELDAPAAEPSSEPEPPPRRGFFARLFGRRAAAPAGEQAEPAALATEEPAAVEPAPEERVPGEPAPREPAVVEPVPRGPVPEEPAPEPVAEASAPEADPDGPAADAPSDPAPRDLQAVLDDVLDALGSAHHRPFSRG
jgi:hypothetical protein